MPRANPRANARAKQTKKRGRPGNQKHRRRRGKPIRAKRERSAVAQLLGRLRPQIVEAGRASFGVHGLYRLVARAALVKAFEFGTVCQKNSPEPFFLMATLRGICEDTIVLTFLASVPERDDVVRLLVQKNLAEAANKQEVFFKSTRPWQPVLSGTEERVHAARVELETLARSKGWGKDLPNVRRMAELCTPSLLPLYDYLYSATSRIVHFSPHVLMRMGWGPAPAKTDPQALQAVWTFSTRNFSQYYVEFSRFYSVYLLGLLARTLLDEFSDRVFVLGILDALDRALASEIRWPEITTFEEHNLKAPSFIQRILLRAVHHAESSDADSTATDGT